MFKKRPNQTDENNQIFLISKYIKYTSSGLDGGGSAEAEPRPWGLLGIERVDGSGYCESLVELE